LGSSFDRLDLILAALFLWMYFFLVARSVREIALTIWLGFFDFFAIRIATSKEVEMFLLTFAFLLEERSALFAVTVTGIIIKRIQD